jgi:hypothetical protein
MSQSNDLPEIETVAHLPMTDLEERFAALSPPKDRGRVVHMFARPAAWKRIGVDSAVLTPNEGMPDDRWAEIEDDERRMQLATISSRVAEMIANGQSPSLFGDNLFVDLDLSEANLPHGSRLRIGLATCEVTPEPHNGCLQFRDRFGADALRFVSRREGRGLNLRGIYLRVVEAGRVSVGDPVEVLSRS